MESKRKYCLRYRNSYFQVQVLLKAEELLAELQVMFLLQYISIIKVERVDKGGKKFMLLKRAQLQEQVICI